MKVGEAGALPDLPDPRKRIKGKDDPAPTRAAGAKEVEAPAFGKAFLDASRATVTRALDQILDELNSQGEKLAAAQNFDELEKYKALVKEFFQKVTSGLAKLHFTDGGTQGKAAKVHVILQKVDMQLDALAKDVLSKQTTQMRILEKLDQIRGLLLDLYK
jgi:uncharacterized protein YaaR (DUF327 family)